MDCCSSKTANPIDCSRKWQPGAQNREQAVRRDMLLIKNGQSELIAHGNSSPGYKAVSRLPAETCCSSKTANPSLLLTETAVRGTKL